jgi:putative membrane protein
MHEAKVSISGQPEGQERLLCVALALIVVLMLWSGWHPYDRATWWMEVAPVGVAVPVLVVSYRRYPLTSLLYGLIVLHACVLMLGGAYTYARVPLGFQLAEWLGLHRNPYDKIGHFFQGLVPAMVAREVLMRGPYQLGRNMLVFLVICVVLAISASYELIEWGAALALGQGADEFLGTQGDPWDTQSDMAFALLGSICALVFLSRWHNLQLARMGLRPSRPFQASS